MLTEKILRNSPELIKAFTGLPADKSPVTGGDKPLPYRHLLLDALFGFIILVQYIPYISTSVP